jgi:hypothetical protein
MESDAVVFHLANNQWQVPLELISRYIAFSKLLGLKVQCSTPCILVSPNVLLTAHEHLGNFSKGSVVMRRLLP